MRGYGDTPAHPDDPSKFTVLHLVGDLILLLDAIAPGEKKEDTSVDAKLFAGDHDITEEEPGEIEAEFANIGVKEVVKNFLAFRTPGPFYFPKGKGFGYSAERVPWLTEEDLDYYVSKFEQTGFTGGVNYYRALGL
ncbi:UNVERIFIED_CONTAM: hypothetical protein Sradi_2763500 [Sesamum radiatum]|uniref:Uncharacterized protein n=1 Tax=Sesamum radiatum TaxID=300843 RepID=A0AAW2S8G0_SESRA